MKIHELMTTDVVTVGVGTPLKDAAALMAEHNVSGLPVVDPTHRVLGVLSEGDILYRETGRRANATVLGRMGIGISDTEAARRSIATTAGEAMSTPAVTLGPERPASDAATVMIDRQINRLPVVDDDGVLIGIVTRADLVRAFVRSDEELAREIREDVFGRALWLDPECIQVEVHGGEVRLSGQVETKVDAELVSSFVERVPGVMGVSSKLSWCEDEG
jgi:CBS domain-containing protein